MGNRWAAIARCIEGRTDNCVKNHFYSQFRKAIRVVNELIKLYYKKSTNTIRPNIIRKIVEVIESESKNSLKIN